MRLLLQKTTFEHFKDIKHQLVIGGSFCLQLLN